MNKKQYQQPAIKYLLVEEQELMAASGDVVLTVVGDEVTTGYADTRKSTSIWDDDEEE